LEVLLKLGLEALDGLLRLGLDIASGLLDSIKEDELKLEDLLDQVAQAVGQQTAVLFVVELFQGVLHLLEAYPEQGHLMQDASRHLFDFHAEHGLAHLVHLLYELSDLSFGVVFGLEFVE
jgi:hypothetical protein